MGYGRHGGWRARKLSSADGGYRRPDGRSGGRPRASLWRRSRSPDRDPHEAGRGRQAGHEPRPEARRMLHGRRAGVRAGRYVRPAGAGGPQSTLLEEAPHGGAEAARGGAAPAAADERPPRRAAQRGPPLRPVLRALRPLPGCGHAVLLRLFRLAGRHAGAGPGGQEGPYRRQAEPAPERAAARHRLRLGRARPHPGAHGAGPGGAGRDAQPGAACGGRAAGPGARGLGAGGVPAARLPRRARAVRPHRVGGHVRACGPATLPGVLRHRRTPAGRGRRHVAARHRPVHPGPA